jgi:putative ABC transport system ATP-binding protein
VLPVVEVTDLHVRFAAVTVLKGISMHVAPRESVAVLGPSGSGKSTLLAAVAGQLKPDRGSVVVSATNYALVHQSVPILPSRTVLENVKIACLAAGQGFTEAAECAAGHLRSVRVDERTFHNRAGQLSGGERQRLGLARAVALQPDLLLADEPTAQLDRASAAVVIEVIAAGALEGIASLVATHDPRLAAACDRAVSLE